MTSPASPFSRFVGSYYVAEEAKAVDRTKTGLLVLSISSFLSWVPVLGYIVLLFELAGAILVILGRKAFGPTHARNVILSIVIFVGGFVSAAIGGAVLFLSNPQYNPSSGPQSLLSNTTLYAAVLVVATAIVGVAEVLFTYALQLKTGRILLWCGYVAAVAAEAVSYVLLSNFGYLNSLPLIAPGLLFGYAYYLARTRIVRGEIPKLSTNGSSSAQGIQ